MPSRTNQKKLSAFDEFYSMLEQGTAHEGAWQAYFERNPFVLSSSLPLRAKKVFSHVQLESGVPDYVLTEGPASSAHFGAYGIVELKKPTDNLLRVYSTRHLMPSYKLSAAQVQAQRYLNELAMGAPRDKRFSFALGNGGTCFIIMGHSEEVIRKCHSTLFQTQFRSILPQGFQVIPYDELLRRFSAAIPKRLSITLLELGPITYSRRVYHSRIWQRPPESLVNAAGSRFTLESTEYEPDHVRGSGGKATWTHTLRTKSGSPALQLQIDWSYMTYSDDSEDWPEATWISLTLFERTAQTVFKALRAEIDELPKWRDD
jgi:hypothetical protein